MPHVAAPSSSSSSSSPSSSPSNTTTITSPSSFSKTTTIRPVGVAAAAAANSNGASSLHPPRQPQAQLPPTGRNPPSLSSATPAGSPLPRVSDALPDLDTNSPSGVIDPRTAADARQRLLHARFPSLNRIRSARKFPHDSLPLRHNTDDSTPLIPRSSLRSECPVTFAPDHTSFTTTVYADSDTVASTLPSPTSFYSAGSPDSSPPPSQGSGRPQEEKQYLESKGVYTSRSDSPLGRQDEWKETAAKLPKKVNMHQTSSKLLRMTDDDRPFTKDFKDLFSTLMVSLPLTAHRVRFSKVEHTFSTEEAITNLGSLKFSQSNRMPDPKDPSRIVTTTTTTTFSMAKEMARSVCNRFLEARFVESCEGKLDFSSKNGVWQLTPKGLRVLSRFCSRNGISQRHVNQVLDSPRNTMQLVILERETATDKINHDRATVDVIFRRFAGESPNIKATSAASDTDSLAEYSTGLVGVYVIKSRNANVKDCPYVFTGKSCIDWLLDCCMTVDRRECLEISNLFIGHDLISAVPEEKNLEERKFQPLKSAHYHITTRGMKLAGWLRSPAGSIHNEPMSKLAQNVGRDSTNNRMAIILRDPALRLLFREFLQDIHCEENLTFYLDVKNFLADYAAAKRANPPRVDVIRENLASAYSLYNAFLAPGSPCELNIDHNLRNALAGRMTRAVGEDMELMNSLDEVAVLFDQAQTSVFKLMASDSVPKFARDPKYASVLRERNLEHLLVGLNLH